MDIGEIRKEYTQFGLNREDLAASPFAQFEKWFQQAREAELKEVNAMSIATVRADGMPQVRTVLLKLFDQRGFVFFTNYNSAKAQEIDANPQASLLFPWLDLERQVRISGQVEKISKAESFKYFTSRPKGSQLGAWISEQSQVISSRTVLKTLMNQVKEKFKDGKIPLPDSWGGYRIMPESFEFWQGRANRLHDRFKYELNEGHWHINRLAP
ncbi:pyridoxamine 5'-phosphate oxidase [Marinicella sp. S1101]|uniref:pyridoxamine 5'-phosphate oxidase n=1 Tax=Marinicella marina TaxID=2996016 RepID=UPI002260C7FD|nr:pyridoxamine 5'-phosphate oxidase [Marinicella marina]MCX7555199.1 pyridoxamine 5'-phosphate oxidase [Marinicella marina]MDJ1140755.1 pyridoxamine 5'-phosphate oxidase [Marinicella marina]